MKLYTLTFALVLFIVGCSSDDDGQPMDDAGTTTGEGTTGGQHETVLPVVVDEQLRSIFEIINGKPFAVVSALMDAIYSGPPDFVGFEEVSQTPSDIDGVEFVRLYNCPSTGTMSRIWYSLGDEITYAFNGCDTGNFFVSGTINGRYAEQLGLEIPGHRWDCEQCTIRDTRSGAVYTYRSLDVNVNRIQDEAITWIPGSEWSASELIVENGSSGYSLQGLVIDEVDDQQRLETGEYALNVQIDKINLPSDLVFQAITDSNFVRTTTRLQGDPTTGSIRLKNDSTTITLNADSGNQDSFLLTVEKGEFNS